MSSMSNAQQGTRGLSSSDWTRLKRISGAKPIYLNNFTQRLARGTPPNNASATIFVIACIDPRYTAALEAYLLSTLGSTTTYDLFVLAGAALGGGLTGNGPTLPKCSIVSVDNDWQTALQDHIQIAITLHNVRQILVVDHLDCGAYTACGQSGSVAAHKAKFDWLRSFILTSTYYPNSNVGLKEPGASIFRGIYGFYFTAPTRNAPNNTILFNYAIPPIEKFRTIFPPTNSASILILGCIDPRFTSVMSEFLTSYKEVKFDYDLFTLAGSSLGVNQSLLGNYQTIRSFATRGEYPNNILADGTAGIGSLGVHWGPTFFDHINIAIALHGITEVWVFDHLDCGAYKAIRFGDLDVSDADPDVHITEIYKLKGYISQSHPTLNFKGFIMDISGEITNVVNTGGIEFIKPLGSFTNRLMGALPISRPLTFGASRIRFTASEYTDLKAFNTADYITQMKSFALGCNLNSTELVVRKLCTCSTPPYSANKQGLCIKCSHDNRWQFTKSTN